eukprot:TRINITY_DN1424_c0_g1_i1.p1 TRINITY_DN1424_c0_g1~~TRINITY_DN1424_c0_g1_i1.p1  ORF type:complete len:218 (+),score=68.11 TRINITY_DN1424_c0_g1_i1:144-797(+)
MSRWWETGRKIVAIGRNYAEHAKELGNAVPSKPFFFLKPTSSYIREGQNIEIPEGADVHHEVELGVIIGKPGRDIPVDQAMDHVAGYCLSLDMTARNLQAEAKAKGLPWSAAKGYDTFCPISAFIPRDRIPDPSKVELWLNVNGKQRQRGTTDMMLFNIPSLISYVSTIMTLEKDDLIQTGTPSGVGPVVAGDVVTAGLTDILEMKFDAVLRKQSKL